MSDALYRGVADKLRADILAGVYHPGEKLPPARVLASEYSCDDNIVKWAFRLLANEGLLVSARGGDRGTYVAQKPDYQAITLPPGAGVTIRMPSPEERELYGISFVGIPVFVVRVPGEDDKIYPGHNTELVTTSAT